MKTYHPFYIGFDRISSLIDEVEKATLRHSQTAYPPYNIVRDGEYKYIVEVAVAGFSRDQIDVTVHENTLTVSTNPVNEQAPTTYIHRGIAERAFVRKFTLADTIEVRDVTLENGMLRIHLENVIPESRKPRKFEIRQGAINSEPQLLVEQNAELPKETVESTLAISGRESKT